MKVNLLEFVASIIVELAFGLDDGDGFDFEDVAFLRSSGHHSQESGENQLILFKF